jgi:hypothetical protein
VLVRLERIALGSLMSVAARLLERRLKSRRR